MNKLIGTTVAISSLTAEQQKTLAEGNMCFESTLTVEQFKEEEKVDEVRILRNPHTRKLFMAYGARTGMVSLKGVPTHPMISHVICLAKTRTGEVIEGMAQHSYLIHEEGTGVANEGAGDSVS